VPSLAFPQSPPAWQRTHTPSREPRWGHAWRRYRATRGSHLFSSSKTLLLRSSRLHSFLCPTGQIVLCLICLPPLLCTSLIKQKPANRAAFWVSEVSTLWLHQGELTMSTWIRCPAVSSAPPRRGTSREMFFDAIPGSGPGHALNPRPPLIVHLDVVRLFTASLGLADGAS
jgi:hypothetical protein